MKIIPCQQGSLEWLAARAGIPTASEFDNLVTPEFKIRTGEMPNTYLAQKIAEFWTGGAIAGYMSLDMEFGKILEEQAIPFYELTFDEEIQRVGLITTNDGKIGCSPDGLIGDNCGIEIKCPNADTHVKYLLSGEVPKQYLAQIHGGMFVTGRPLWRFMSYRRGFPPLIKAVERDEKIQATLKQSLDYFLERFDDAVQKLKTLNGGTFPERSSYAESIKNSASESVDDGHGITP